MIPVIHIFGGERRPSPRCRGCGRQVEPLALEQLAERGVKSGGPG